MPGPSVSITLFEPVAYLRGQSASGEARGRRHTSTIHHESAPSQLRGLVTVYLPKPTRVKSVELTLFGEGRTDWPEGIGNNRIELAEVSQIIKQQVTLFDARANDAPLAPPLRRAHSMGPGIGFGDQDDLDWNMADHQHTSSSGPSRSDREREAREAAAKMAKSVGKAAAKAGSAILPPTLREMTGSGRSGSSSKSREREGKRQKSSDRRQPSGSNSIPATPSGSNTPARNSMTLPRSVGDRGSQQQLAPHDPPPDYEQIDTPPATASTSPSAGYFNQSANASPTHNNLVTAAFTPTLPPQSRPAAGPHGRSILHRREATNGAATTIPATAAGHSSSRSPSVPPSPTVPTSSSQHVVRFGPPDEIVPPPEDESRGRPRGMSGPHVINATQWPPSDMVSASPDGATLPSSAPHSRRPSLDRLTQALEALPSVVADKDGNPPAKSSSKDKGKGKATPDGLRSPTLAKKSLKQLLAGSGRKGGEGSGSWHGKHGSSPSPSGNSRPTSSSGRREGSGAPTAGGGAPGDTEPHPTPSLNQPPCDWREFKKGTYTYSISLPLPANLPPTLYADFGRNTYTLKAVVKRSGPLTPNLSCEREVVMVHAPDEEGTEETEAIVVERTWEDALTYRVFVSGRSFACGSKIPLWIKFIPLGEKVRLWRLTAVLEEKTHYYAKGRKVARHETPRRWTLLKLMGPDGKPLVPIISDEPNALRSSVLADYAIAASEFHMPADARRRRTEAAAQLSAIAGPSSNPIDRIAVMDSDDEEAEQDALASLLDPAGPWELSIDLQLPGAGTRINLSTDHAKSSIAVHHLLRLTFRVEKADGSSTSASKAKAGTGEALKPKLYDIVIECPIAINHSRTSDIWLSLPNYWSVAGDAPPAPPGNSVVIAEPDCYFSPRTSSSSPSTPAGLPQQGGSASAATTPTWMAHQTSSSFRNGGARSSPTSPPLGAPTRTLGTSTSSSGSGSGLMSPTSTSAGTHSTLFPSSSWYGSYNFAAGGASAPATPTIGSMGRGRSSSPASPMVSPHPSGPGGWRGTSAAASGGLDSDAVAARQSASHWLSLSTQAAAQQAAQQRQGATTSGADGPALATARYGGGSAAAEGADVGIQEQGNAIEEAASGEEEPPPYSGPPSGPTHPASTAATAAATPGGTAAATIPTTSLPQPPAATVTATQVETSTA